MMSPDRTWVDSGFTRSANLDQPERCQHPGMNKRDLHFDHLRFLFVVEQKFHDPLWSLVLPFFGPIFENQRVGQLVVVVQGDRGDINGVKLERAALQPLCPSQTGLWKRN